MDLEKEARDAAQDISGMPDPGCFAARDLILALLHRAYLAGETARRELDAKWTPVAEAPDNIKKCLAVEDDPITCRWFFAYRKNGVWRDLNNETQIEPTHCMDLPAHPSAPLSHKLEKVG